MVHIFHHLVVALIIKKIERCAAAVVVVFSSDFLLLVGDRLFMSGSDRGEIFLGFFRVCKVQVHFTAFE